MVDDPLGALLGRQRGRVEPPAEVAEPLAHRRGERLVPVEEELLTRVALLRRVRPGPDVPADDEASDVVPVQEGAERDSAATDVRSR